MSTTETTTMPCGHETSSGPCVRPLGHNPKTGHRSLRANSGGSSAATPEIKAALEALRKARAEAAEKAKGQRLQRLITGLSEFDMKAVPMTKKEIAERDAAKKAEETEASETKTAEDAEAEDEQQEDEK